MANRDDFALPDVGGVDAGWVTIGLVMAAGFIIIKLAALVCRALTRSQASVPPPTATRKFTIVYASQKGTARGFAHRVFTAVSRWRAESAAKGAYLGTPTLVSAAKFDPEELCECDIVVLVLATYTDGKAPEGCEQFRADFEEMANDFRYGGSHLAGQQFFVFGLGDVAYANNFNRFAKDACEWLKSLGGERLAQRFASEKRARPLITQFVGDIVRYLDSEFERGAPRRNAVKAAESAKTAAAVPLESESDDGGDDAEAKGVDDLEDAAGIAGEGDPRGELLFPRLRESLTKQGYRLIGSHSGVKLCRWTKAMLRGRGGCYKHTFYNISSYQCMEMTPSLACANKCVFCWRHHTNPVGKEFTWKVDPPEFLIDNAIAAHQGMVKPMKGVSGVTPDRLAEAMNVKHCALSLVGEPIMYPRISEFVDILHHRHISTFMVTNAQFPDRIKNLSPVTQLYLSIDAATKSELKAIDRPLFDDFWERLLASIDELRAKPQRTVFRLTLVEGFNMTNLEAYCELIERGAPDFIEIKGVTYCGNSDASPITMAHVPFHSQVVDFCNVLTETLKRRKAAGTTWAPAKSPKPSTTDEASAVIGSVPHTVVSAPHREDGGSDYAIACEHEHSCCVLIAHERFRVRGVWHTWIDYAKFFDLIASGREFSAPEYSVATPGWALFRSAERGFDPAHTRHYRKKRAVPGGGC